MEKPCFEKNGRFFLRHVVDWSHVAQVRFWRPKRPHLFFVLNESSFFLQSVLNVKFHCFFASKTAG